MMSASKLRFEGVTLVPRGHRFRLEGQICHITDRCHRKQFLLRFARDRRAWVRWLYRSRKRFGLCVLNYQVTSNHIHLLVRDRGHGEVARSMQLVAGCVARAYNTRKQRRGAYWEDFYHSTVVDTDEHLARCFTYIDLNMVRAGVVDHPRDWQESGYQEIQNPPGRYRIIDRRALAELLAVDERDLDRVQNEWIDLRLGEGELEREGQWSEAVAVGRASFVEGVKDRLGQRARYRQIEENDGTWLLREPSGAYGCNSAGEIDTLTTKIEAR
jgi:putative transposase